jgi:dihydrofolate synthase/folylpolyglutamate synthase
MHGIERVQKCLSILGNPHLFYQVIHVAGTSGKWSTCTYLSNGLQSQWYSVWLTLSPHLIDITERFVCNGSAIDPKILRTLLQTIQSAIDQTNTIMDQQLSYFEICTIVALVRFHQCKVDIAIIETWLWWKYDSTNCIIDKIWVITDIWLDHTHILWDTLDKIAYQKAMISHPHNHIFCYLQWDPVDTTIKNTVSSQKAILHHYDFTQDVHIYDINHQTSFVFWNPNWQNYIVQWGLYQVKNASLALQVIYRYQSNRHISIDYQNLHHAIEHTSILWRNMEIQLATKKILIDGAHNPQKMQHYLNYITTIYPNQTFDFIVWFKIKKDRKQMIDLIMPFAHHLYCLQLPDDSQDLIIHFVDPMLIESYCIQSWYDPHTISIVPYDQYNLIKLINQTTHLSVVTWSLYLTGMVLSVLWHH